MSSKEIIPDHAPVVSMDIALGQRFKNVTFDYEAFEHLYARMGNGATEASHVDITIKAGSMRRGNKVGYYQRNGHRADIVVQNGLWRPEHSINQRLIHELQHERDDYMHNIQMTALLRVGNIAALTSPYAVTALLTSYLAAGAVFEIEALQELQEAAAMACVTTLLGTIAIGAVSQIGYFCERWERRAFKAEKKYRGHTIVRFEK